MVDVGIASLTLLRLAEPTAQSRRCVAPQDHCQKNELDTEMVVKVIGILGYGSLWVVR